MVLLLRKIVRAYSDIMQYKDPRAEVYTLMGSPIPITVILTLYLLIVKYGPVLMRDRKPFELKGVIMAYNILQVFFNSFGLVLTIMTLPKFSILCTPVDKSNSSHAFYMVKLHYLYFVLKVVDLLDTVFFVLRKKFKQMSFLHIYHHFVVTLFSWITCKFYPGGQLLYLGTANVAAHAIMYTYYFLTSWDSKYKGSVWWKKHITQSQLVQHYFIFFSFVIPLLNPNCDYPKFLLAAYLPQMLMMIFMFTDFYVKNFVKKKDSNINNNKINTKPVS